MKQTMIHLLCCILALLCAVLPSVAEETKTGNTPLEETLEEGSILTYGDYTYQLCNNGEYLYWEVTEYQGQYLPRRTPDVNIPAELEGFPVDGWDWIDQHREIYSGLNRESGNYLYAPVSETECYLTGYEGFEKLLTIPSEIDGYTVTGIADEAFAYRGFTQEPFASIVIFPDTIRYVGRYAFNMTSVLYFALNEGLEIIDDGAFSDINQNVLILPSTLKEIGSNPFHANYYVGRDNQPLILTEETGFHNYDNGTFAVVNDALYSLADFRLIAYLDNMWKDWEGDNNLKFDDVYTVSEGTEIIGEYAFFATMNLEQVIIPDGVKEIRNDAFGCCVNLKEINIPDTVTAIGDYAFYNCSGLTALTIPASVLTIGKEALPPTVTVTCSAGSAAEAYCIAENIPYITEP